VRRREFIGLLGSAAVWPLAARGHGERVRRVGIVMPYAKGDSEIETRVHSFKQKLAELGWKEGGNIEFVEHWTTDNMERVQAEAAALVASNPDIMIATGGRVVPVLMRLTGSIPIVLPGASDPVGVGWAKSLARPGGNVTGLPISSFRCSASRLRY
jgi:putative ABC transport system substrate-binding protein